MGVRRLFHQGVLCMRRKFWGHGLLISDLGALIYHNRTCIAFHVPWRFKTNNYSLNQQKQGVLQHLLNPPSYPHVINSERFAPCSKKDGTG